MEGEHEVPAKYPISFVYIGREGRPVLSSLGGLAVLKCVNSTGSCLVYSEKRYESNVSKGGKSEMQNSVVIFIEVGEKYQFYYNVDGKKNMLFPLSVKNLFTLTE